MGEEVTIGGVAVPRAEKFKYLGSILKRNEILTKILTNVLEWDGKSGVVLPEFRVIGKFL